MNELSGIIFDIDHFAVHDGPGIRTCVYFKGCPLRCAWCHSPESQSATPQLLYTAVRCVNCCMCVSECPLVLHHQDASTHTHTFTNREHCTHCGRCADVCPTGALRMCGKSMRATEVSREALKDIAFYNTSGGGVTLSGGEVLSQAAFALEILRFVKEAGVHTIVETSGFGRETDILALVPFIDCFYFDFKLFDAALFKQYIGHGMDLICKNLRKLREHTANIVLRIPLIPCITDTEENLRAAINLAKQLHITEIQLLPYNTATGAKYEWIGREYSLAPILSNNPNTSSSAIVSTTRAAPASSVAPASRVAPADSHHPDLDSLRSLSGGLIKITLIN